MRERDRKFLAEGRQAVTEALEARRVEILFHAEDDHADLADRARALDGRVVRATDDVLKHLTSTVTPQGVVAVCSFLDVPIEAVRDPRLVAVLCAVRDPGNAGTILRSADAAGADAVVFAGASVDVYNPKTVRASAGSIFHLPVVRGPSEAEAVDALRGAGMQILAADARGAASLDEVDLSRPTALLFGNEAWGLPEETAALADASVRIPMPGRAESLNLAAAATLLLFEAARASAGQGRGAAAPDAPGLAEWIAGSAHDLRSPLTGLTGFTKMLLRRWDRMTQDQRAELLRGIEIDGERVGVNVKRVIDAARGELGTLKPVREQADLRAIAERVRDTLEAREIAVEVDLPAAPVRIEGDPDRLSMTVLALAEAAAWWAHDDDPPRLSLALDAGRVRIAVTRPGPDGPWPFTPDGEGKGIGVALLAARSVVAAHGGTWEEALDADGLRFVVTLRMRMGD